MDKLQERLHQLKWLQHAGIKYYCSEQKDSQNSLVNKINEKYKDNSQDNIASITISKAKSETKMRSYTIKENDDLTINIAKARQLAESANSLQELKTIVENYDGCALKNFARNTVFSDGQPSAKILLIGEAPGVTEDEKGIPFCGESGRLLDEMLNTIGLDRQQNIYITNTIFWRPPANRRPTPEEINICKPFVEKHIALLSPQMIILVGGTATTTLLTQKKSISHIRKNYYPNINK